MVDERTQAGSEQTGRTLLTRRRALSWLAAAGLVGSIGVGTAALVRDREALLTAATSGVVDLETEWLSSGQGITSGGDSGVETVAFGLPHRDGDNNPAYVWAKTRCPTRDFADDILVQVSLETPENEYALTETATRYSDVRAEFGTGVFLHHLEGEAPGPLQPRSTASDSGPWKLHFDWEAHDRISGRGNLRFGLELYAIQARNVSVAQAQSVYAPDWPACSEDAEAGDGGFSYAAFGATSPLSKSDFTVLKQGGEAGGGDASTLHYELASGAPRVQEVAVKLGTELTVFDTPEPRAGTIRVSDTGGVSYEQAGNSFSGTTPVRSNPDPCPSYCGTYKFHPDGPDEVKNSCESQ